MSQSTTHYLVKRSTGSGIDIAVFIDTGAPVTDKTAEAAKANPENVRGLYGSWAWPKLNEREGEALELMPFEEAYKLQTAAERAKYCKGVKRVDEERFNWLLEVLPPSRWTRGAYFECFHMSERITGNLVTWAIRTGKGEAAKYWEVNEDAKIAPDALQAMCREAEAKEGTQPA